MNKYFKKVYFKINLFLRFISSGKKGGRTYCTAAQVLAKDNENRRSIDRFRPFKIYSLP